VSEVQKTILSLILSAVLVLFLFLGQTGEARAQDEIEVTFLDVHPQMSGDVFVTFQLKNISGNEMCLPGKPEELHATVFLYSADGKYLLSPKNEEYPYHQQFKSSYFVLVEGEKRQMSVRFSVWDHNAFFIKLSESVSGPHPDVKKDELFIRLRVPARKCPDIHFGKKLGFLRRGTSDVSVAFPPSPTFMLPR